MQDSKPWYQSKGILGAITAFVPTLVIGLKFFGVDIADLGSELTSGLLGLLGLIGTILAIVGRCKAWKAPIITASATGKALLPMFCMFVIAANTAMAGPPEPLPTPGWYQQVGDTIKAASEQRAIEVVIAPTYAPKLADHWGASIALLHPLGENAFVGVRGDWLNGGYFAGSASVGLKAKVNLAGFDFTPFALTGLVSPLTSNAGDKQFQPGAIAGAGVACTVWENKAKTMKVTGFGEAEYWSQYPGIQIYHLGAQASLSW
jgi:hypothetical protein